MFLHRWMGGCRAAAGMFVLWSLCSVPAAALGGELFIDLGRGPVLVRVPSSYDPATPAPLLMLLHGYSSNGAAQEAYMQFAPIAEEFGLIYLHPDGLIDDFGSRYWNGTDACCDFFGDTDDSGYLRALIEEVRVQLNVDERRVYIVGHSNGGFMSYRMACDHADIVAAIASLAGATFLNPVDCLPTEPVHVLQIHGDADDVVLYNGGCFVACYPGAVQTTETWAAYNGCAIEGDTSARPIDLDAVIPGNETVITRYETDCAPGGSAELWTIVGGGHVPNLAADFSLQVVEFLLAHPKPGLTGDIDGDGSVGTPDLLLLLGAWGRCDDCDNCLEDLDGDCAVGPSDLIILLGNWG